MALTPEKKVKMRVSKILDEHGVYYFYPATGGFGRSGVPDIVACYKGHFIAIECKAGNNAPTALQIRELNRIESAGGDTIVVNESNAALVTMILERVTNVR